jgi:2-polyprenyl-6-hydroxyphenyl methylase/3-demethylubiquinone-9 3-methyltransferase
VTEPQSATIVTFVVFALFSALFVTKDEWVHSAQCSPTENWLHSVMFILHPLVFLSAGLIWINPESFLERSTSEFLWLGLQGHLGIVVLFLVYQLIYWPFFGAEKKDVDNRIYDELGDRWYLAYDDPVALLRAECKIKKLWIEEKLNTLIQGREAGHINILDVGCGAGFLANDLGRSGFSVTGVDLSESSLQTARKFDSTHNVKYQKGDATRLDFEPASFDAVTALDLLEHVENPEAIVEQASRVLKPGGLFFFHTFNRNVLSRLVIIKFVEWFVKNTPPQMHVHHLFIKPEELEAMAAKHGFTVLDWVGLKPQFSTITLKSLLTRTVPHDFTFRLTSSLGLSYMGVARLDRVSSSVK